MKILIADSKKKDIIDSLNKSITEYSEKMSKLDINKVRNADFDSIITSFYRSITGVFKALLNIKDGKDDFHILIEKFIIEFPEALTEHNIDLFYILRYRDDRSNAEHVNEFEKQDPFPRLFLNGKRLVEKYIIKDDGEALINDWNTKTNKFDFVEFIQEFGNSPINHRHIRILVVGPMHDIPKEKLAYLGRYHFNVVLDFDPYSARGGFCEAVGDKKKNFSELYKSNDSDETNFNRNFTEILMCDGNIKTNVHSFMITSEYLPSRLDGKRRNCWPYYREDGRDSNLEARTL